MRNFPRWPVGAVFCLLIGMTLGGCKFTEDIDNLVIGDISPASVKDGEYEGSQYNNPVTAKVRLAVKEGEINGIRILEHGHGPGHGADAIVNRVLAAQSLSVDSVSGATYSSKVMLKAIESALKQGQ